MIDTKFIEDVANRLMRVVPSNVSQIQQDIALQFRSILFEALSRFDIVTHDEFDTQMNVLARTRSKVEALEKQVAHFENESIS